jgi:hypothetical protein
MYQLEMIIALLLGMPIGLGIGWVVKRCLIKLGVIEKDK